MIDLALEMEQYDCPYIDTSADHDVSFSSFQWCHDESNRTFETRMVVEGDDRAHLDAGLEALRDHDRMTDYSLLKRWNGAAHIRSVIEETNAMATVRRNEGYITGPFVVEDGSELWHVGFDSADGADRTLAELEAENEFAVVSQERRSMPALRRLVQHAGPATELLEACLSLSEVERETLAAAVERGYFDSPRQATLGTLAEQFDVSKPAISKNLRRGQGKILERVVSALDDLEGTDT